MSMKKIICEMCEGTEFKKENGEFICCGCNTHYSVEEAKGMMIEVEGEENISAPKDNELDNLYMLARRAKEDDNSENAAKYYEMIMIKEPTSWEASFYCIYYKAMSCKIAQIMSAGNSVTNCLKNVLTLVKEKNNDEAEHIIAVKEIGEKCSTIATMLFSGAVDHYCGIDGSIRNNYTQEMLNNCRAAICILYTFGDLVESIFDAKKDFGETAAKAWKLGISLHNSLMSNFAQKEVNKNIIVEYSEKVKKYDPSYQTPEVNTTTTSGGCYVATAVYGSYDCPEVWTLRRYRDTTLAETIFGRAFIHTYYAISPTLVKWFGKTQWFKNLFKGKLDKMVKSLNEKGFEDTPYEDKNWK